MVASIMFRLVVVTSRSFARLLLPPWSFAFSLWMPWFLLSWLVSFVVVRVVVFAVLICVDGRRGDDRDGGDIRGVLCGLDLGNGDDRGFPIGGDDRGRRVVEGRTGDTAGDRSLG